MTANSLISANRNRIPKALTAMGGPGMKTRCYHGTSSADEARWIAEQVERLVADGSQLRDICVLYRAHYVTRTLEEELVRRRVPYTIYSGVPFFGRREVKDALAYLRLAVWRDDLSFARVANAPRRNLGEKRMAFLREKADAARRPLYETLKENLDDPIFKGTGAKAFVELVESLADGAETRQASDLLAEALDRSGYEKMLRTEGAQDRLDNLAELKQSVHDYETTCGEEATPADYLSRVALFSNRDADDAAADRVRLMTVHAAKGLEFPRVALCSLSEGVFPTRRARTADAMEEERRLCFVALTRAKDELVLTQASGSDFEGTPRVMSRFLLDIDPALLDWRPKPAAGLLAQARAHHFEPDPGKYAGAQNGQQPFEPGDRVKHAVFGPGEVPALDLEKSAYVIRFDSLPTPRSIAVRIALEKA
jgi:DNA helicase-2/ATP-dependent DNA helicase PcrA